MGGRQPRIYLGFGERKFWQNVEVTVYFQRISDDDKRSSGLIIATRAGYLGHTSDAPCTATTYFGRMRNDGDMDFMKELKHSGGGRREVKPIWQGGPLPYAQWIGAKFIIYNIDDERHVKMELYRDLTKAEDGGTWELLGETIDSGGWVDEHDCGYASDFIPVKGGGVVFVLSSEVQEARYKWLTVREIAPESGSGAGSKLP